MLVNPYFNPPPGIAAQIINRIVTATTKVYVLAFTFNSITIATSLIGALGRGVDVKIIMDGKHVHQRHAAIQGMRTAGIPIYLDWEHCEAHNKVMLIDNLTTITGSYNYTSTAENLNAENILVIEDAGIQAAYLAEFNTHLSHALEVL